MVDFWMATPSVADKDEEEEGRGPHNGGQSALAEEDFTLDYYLPYLPGVLPEGVTWEIGATG